MPPVSSLEALVTLALHFQEPYRVYEVRLFFSLSFVFRRAQAVGCSVPIEAPSSDHRCACVAGSEGGAHERLRPRPQLPEHAETPDPKAVPGS